MKVRVIATVLFSTPSENDPAEYQVRTLDIERNASEASWLDLAQEVGEYSQRTAEQMGWEQVSINLTTVWGGF